MRSLYATPVLCSPQLSTYAFNWSLINPKYLTVKFLRSVAKHFDQWRRLGFDSFGELVLRHGPQLPLHVLGTATQTPRTNLKLGPWKIKIKIVYYSDTREQMNLFFPLIEWTEDNISRYPSYDSADNWHSRVIWYSVSHHNFTTWGSKDWRNAFWTLTTESTQRQIWLWCIC